MCYDVGVLWVCYVLFMNFKYTPIFFICQAVSLLHKGCRFFSVSLIFLPYSELFVKAMENFAPFVVYSIGH